MYPLVIIGTVAMGFFLSWANRNNWGRDSFLDAPIRPNNLPAWSILLLFFVWITGMFVFSSFISLLTGGGGEGDFITQQFALGASSAITGLLGLMLASSFFDGGLAGFGIKIHTARGDFVRAIVLLLKTYPAVLSLMLATAYLVPIVTDGEYDVPPHPLLDYINTEGGILDILFIGFIVIVIAPVLEEIVFRGFMQTKVADNLKSRWLGILLASVFFALIHGSGLWLHWHGLFVFSCALGYAYEKSGSLLQPIFMHSIFNALNLSLSIIYNQAA
jgi:membrane protease YdiL (CAAX protease family)